jgi:hypothetical protein
MKKEFLSGLGYVIVLILFICLTACPPPPVTGSCNAKMGSDDLWNCDKSNCTGKCVLQVRHKVPANPGDTVWRDIPGGNVNDADLQKAGQEVRCDCR